jgi:hypothetical protein
MASTNGTAGPSRAADVDMDMDASLDFMDDTLNLEST